VGFFAMMTLAHRRGWKPDFSRYKVADSLKVFRMAIPLAAFGTLQTLYYRVDSVMLKSLSGNEAVGYYDMAMRVLLVVLSVSQLYSQAIYPAFASVRDKTMEFSRLAAKGSKVLFLLGLPMTVGGYFLAGQLLTFIGGPRYGPSGPAFAILALSILPFFTANIYVDILAIKDTTRLNLQFGFLFLLNVALNFLFVPRWGIEGAAWATVACEYFGVVTGFMLAGRFLRSGSAAKLGKPLMASVVSCVVMAAGLAFWPGLQWLVLGPLVYGAGLVFLGGIDIEEKDQVLRFLRIKAAKKA
jgi:O-antigen/teichoic acid export membrane protein